MFNRLLAVTLAVVLVGCAAPTPKPDLPAAPVEAGAGVGISGSDGSTVGAAAVAIVGTVSEKARVDHSTHEREAKTVAGSITIDCTVKLPDDPTDNPELCRSFQMEVVDEAGTESARFRFGSDARYRFAAKPGKKYRVKPLIGKNWEFTIEPDHDLTMGERAKVQLRQKE